MASAFQFINDTQSSNKSKTSPFTGTGAEEAKPKIYPYKNDSARLYNTLGPDKNNPSPFWGGFGSTPQAEVSSGFGVLNKQKESTPQFVSIDTPIDRNKQPFSTQVASKQHARPSFGATALFSAEETPSIEGGFGKLNQQSCVQPAFGPTQPVAFRSFRPVVAGNNSKRTPTNPVKTPWRRLSKATVDSSACLNNPFSFTPKPQPQKLIPQRNTTWRNVPSQSHQQPIKPASDQNRTTSLHQPETKPRSSSDTIDDTLKETSATKSTTPPVNTTFSSSFIMEDMVEASNITSQASSVAISTSTTNNYVPLVEEINDTSLDQRQSQSVPVASPVNSNQREERLSASENDLAQKKENSSAFPFINNTGKNANTDKTTSKFKFRNHDGGLALSMMKESAFNFINQGNKSPTSPVLSNSFDFSAASIQLHLEDMFIFGPTTPENNTPLFSTSLMKSSMYTEKENETKLLAANTSWRTFQINKDKELDIIKGLYNKESQTQDMIKQLKDKLAQIDKEKDAAITSENYSNAQRLSEQCSSMQYNLQTLSDINLQILQTNIRTSWQRMAALLEKESALAEQVAASAAGVREDTNRYLVRLEEDNQRLHYGKEQDLEKQRANLEKLKSEVAFDYDICKQNETDLNERMDEAVFEEMEKMKNLQSKSKTLKEEIESLRLKLKELESEEKNVCSEIEQVESIIEKKLKPFEVEQKDLADEKISVEQRQAQINEQKSNLDEEDANLNSDMDRVHQVKERGEKEIADFDKRIEYLTERKDRSKAEYDQLNVFITRMIEIREQTVTRHKNQIKESRANIARKSKEIKAIQNKLYENEKTRISLEESIAKITTQVESLAKRKQLDLQNGHFMSAETLSMKIKELEGSLVHLKEQTERMDDSKSDHERLYQDQENLSVLEKELVDLEITLGSDLKAVLESVIEHLEKSLQEQQVMYDEMPSIASDCYVFKSLIEHELKSIQSKLNSNPGQDLISYF